MSAALAEWQVDYGDDRGQVTTTLPHSWLQNIEADAEGPVWYRRSVDVPETGGWLVFGAASYAARVLVNGLESGHHLGMWDAFSIDLCAFAGQSVWVEVELIKPGGSWFPADRVACGELPYHFNTFGGLWKPIWLHSGLENPLEGLPGPSGPRLRAQGRDLTLDGKPFYLRGIRHHGWYPACGHCSPPENVMVDEVVAIRALGFNTVKFCHWIPDHQHLELLDEFGLLAWI